MGDDTDVEAVKEAESLSLLLRSVADRCEQATEVAPSPSLFASIDHLTDRLDFLRHELGNAPGFDSTSCLEVP